MYLYIEIYSDTLDAIMALNGGIPPNIGEAEAYKKKRLFFAYSLDSSLTNKVLTYPEYLKVWAASEEHHSVAGSVF